MPCILIFKMRAATQTLILHYINLKLLNLVLDSEFGKQLITYYNEQTIIKLDMHRLHKTNKHEKYNYRTFVFILICET